MIEFQYEAVDPTGRRRRGIGTAASASGLALQLEQEGFLLVSAEPLLPGATRPGAGRVNHRALLEGIRAVSGLLDTGLPLAKALEFAESTSAPALRAPLADVRQRVSRGEGVAQALAAHPRAFGKLAPSLVRAGERAGDLPAALRALVQYLEREHEVRERLVSAALYPLVLLVFGGIALSVLVLLVIPRFSDLLIGTGVQLPWSTAVVLGLSTALRTWWWLIGAVLVAVGVVIARALKTSEGRRVVGRFVNSLPLIGSVRRDRVSGQVARLLSLLLTGGAPLYQALGETVEALDDPLAGDELTRVRDRVREGAALASTLAQGGVVSEELIQLVAVGEGSGRLAEFVGRAATLLEDRAARKLQRLVALLEPALIVFFGAVVGFVALSLLQAIYGINAGALR